MAKKVGMPKHTVQIYLSYSQLCVFLKTLPQPFNDWSDRNYSQGFSWRPGSVSFRTLLEEGECDLSISVSEPVPSLDEKCMRAIRLPFDVSEGEVEIGSISDSMVLDLSIGQYILQVELLEAEEGKAQKINIRFNKGETDFLILKADETIDILSEMDLNTQPA